MVRYPSAQRLPRWATLLAAVGAGAAMWAAFPDVGAWPLTVLALLLLQFALSRDHAGWNFLVGFVMGAVFWLPHLYWVIDATDVVPWVVLSLTICAPAFGAFGALWTWARRLLRRRPNPWLHALSFAVVWTGVEEWRAHIPFGGFPWGRLAWAAAGAPVGRAAWLGGPVFVTFLLALAAGLLGSAALAAWRRRSTPAVLAPRPAWRSRTVLAAAATGRPALRSRTPGATAAALAALACVFAPLLLPLPRDAAVRAVANPPAPAPVDPGERAQFVDVGTTTAQTGVLNVGFVQGSNSSPGGVGTYNPQEVLDNHLRGTADLAADQFWRANRATAEPYGYALDLVVWPEDSTGWDPNTQPVLQDLLNQASGNVGAPILLGAQEFPATGGRYNLMLLWDGARKAEVSRYAKQRPVPFGEYIPMRSVVRHLSAHVDRVGIDMLAAENPPVILLDSPRLGREVRLGVGICFEVAFDDVIRQAARDGAELILIPTNNVHFGVTAQSTQQLAMAQLQAITTGRSVVQISSVGVSGAFTPDGTLVTRTGLFVPDRFSVQMPLRTSLTPAVRLGAGPGAAVRLLALALPLAGLVLARAKAAGTSRPELADAGTMPTPWRDEERQTGRLPDLPPLP